MFPFGFLDADRPSDGYPSGAREGEPGIRRLTRALASWARSKPARRRPTGRSSGFERSRRGDSSASDGSCRVTTSPGAASIRSLPCQHGDGAVCLAVLCGGELAGDRGPRPHRRPLRRRQARLGGGQWERRGHLRCRRRSGQDPVGCRAPRHPRGRHGRRAPDILVDYTDPTNQTISIRAYDGNGNLIDAYSLQAEAPDAFLFAANVADLFGDGRLEVVAAVGSTTSISPRGIAIFDAQSGALLNYYDEARSPATSRSATSITMAARSWSSATGDSGPARTGGMGHATTRPTSGLSTGRPSQSGGRVRLHPAPIITGGNTTPAPNPGPGARPTSRRPTTTTGLPPVSTTRTP